MICEVCKNYPAIGVISSAAGPVSHAYCSECLHRNAEPEYCFNYLYEEVANKDETKLADFVFGMKTYKDGEYISFGDWLVQRKEEKNG